MTGNTSAICVSFDTNLLFTYRINEILHDIHQMRHMRKAHRPTGFNFVDYIFASSNLSIDVILKYIQKKLFSSSSSFVVKPSFELVDVNVYDNYHDEFLHEIERECSVITDNIWNSLLNEI